MVSQIFGQDKTIKKTTDNQRSWRDNFTVPYFIKGTVSRDFCFWFFWWISFPPAPEYCIRTVSNFFENSRRYSQVKVHHRYQRHRRQIFPPISLVFLIPVANLPPVHLPPVSATPLVHLELRISPRIFEKIRKGPIGILRGLGETDWWKKTEVENLVALSL